MNLILILILFVSISVYSTWTTKIKTPPKLQDYAEKTRVSNLYPESRVTVSVGETNGFIYTVNGQTRSFEKIAVSGDYYNNEITGSGFAWLFMGVDSGIATFNFFYSEYENRLKVVVYNFKNDPFIFEAIPPHVVSVDILRISQVNATAILVSGPSRSAFYDSKIKLDDTITNNIKQNVSNI